MIWLVLLGAGLLTALDAVHTHTGTTAYAQATAFGAAWWAPLLFGGAASIGGWLYTRGHARLGGPRALASGGALARGLLAMSMLYAASGLLPASSETKLALLAFSGLVLFRALDGSRAGAVLLAIGVVAGPLAEAGLIRLGLFHYRDPELLGVPIWLPALYACVTPVIGQVARRALSSRRPPEREAPAP